MSELPTGAVTFLFTDIEGSTRLLKQLRDRWPEALAQHQRLLRAAFAAHGGREVDTQGDSFFVAFARARDAVLAAVDGQLALASHEWPDGTQIKVRMGIHTGQAVASDGRYTGLAVHRAARIGAAGHGGQVLVSQATQTLIEDEEEDLDLFVRDLGEQRLKDLERPVRLYQVAADGLPTEFPPVRQDASLAQAAEAVIAPPLWRRPAVLVPAALVLAALIAAGAFLATRSSRGGGLAGVAPNNVGVIDPKTNEIVAQIPVVAPGPITAGRTGPIWVGDLKDRSLTVIDPKTRTVTGNVPLEATPTGLAVGFGAVWVAEGLLGRLARVDAQFRTVAWKRTLAGHSDLLGSVTTGGDFVWAVYGDSTLVRVDPATGASSSTTAGAAPTGVAYGARSVWVANRGGSNVFRYAPDTFTSGPVAAPITVGTGPRAIAFGSGAVWVANYGNGSVTRIDAGAGSQQTTAVGRGPSAVAVGAGAVWVVNADDGTISRIDPTTDPPRVVKTVRTGNHPTGITIAGGFVWVGVQAP
jgi:YVTN family beta-propeller protein